MTTPQGVDALVDKIAHGRRLTTEERTELIERLGIMGRDHRRPAADRMAAILMRASLIAGEGT